MIGLKTYLDKALNGKCKVYRGEAPTEVVFPCIIFDIVPSNINSYMKSASDFEGQLVVALFDRSDGGSSKIAQLQNEIENTLHKVFFTAEGWVRPQLLLMKPGNVMKEEYNIKHCEDIYRILASGTIGF